MSRDLVPVALNLYEIIKARGPGGDFYRAVRKQRPSQHQGLYVVSPAGKVLASQASAPSNGSWVSHTLRMIEAGLQAHGEVGPRQAKWVDPLPYRGRGVNEDGGIVLAVTTRHMLQGLDRRGLGDAVHDSVPLSAGERATLGVPEARAGVKFEVPPRVVRAFHKVLSPVSDLTTLARRDEVTRARLMGKVERVRGGIAYLRFEGSITAAHVYQAGVNKGRKNRAEVTLAGVGSADGRTGKLLSLTLVGEGQYLPPDDRAKRYGAVLEWRAE